MNVAPKTHPAHIVSLCELALELLRRTQSTPTLVKERIEEYRKTYDPIPGASLKAYCAYVVAANAMSVLNEEQAFIDREHYADYYSMGRIEGDPYELLDVSSSKEFVFLVKNDKDQNCFLVLTSNDNESVDMALHTAEAFNLFNSFITEKERNNG